MPKILWGNAYSIGSKIASTVDRHTGTFRRIVRAVAPMTGALTGPVGSAVGTGINLAMKTLSTYDSLKNEAMGHMFQASQVALAAKRGSK